MKKIIYFILPFLLILTGCNTTNKVVENGTKENPYLIYSAADFLDFAGRHLHSVTNLKDEHYKLMEDINLMNLDIMPIGISASFSFDGHFDGNNHTIKNVKITTNDYCVGLFGYLGKGASVTNLTLENINYNQTSTATKALYCGGIAGVLDYNAIIENCHVVGNITTKYGIKEEEYTKNYAGGIVGASYGSINNCSAKINICGDNVGGIVGKTIATNFGYNNVYDSYVYGENSAGSIAAYIDDSNFDNVKISAMNVINTTIEGNQKIGGILGECIGLLTISNSFINTNIIAKEKGTYVGSVIGKHQKYGGSGSLTIDNCLIESKIQIDSTNCNFGIIGCAANTFFSNNSIWNLSIDANLDSLMIDQTKTTFKESKIYLPLNNHFANLWECEKETFDKNNLLDTLLIPSNWIKKTDDWFYLKKDYEILSNLKGKGTEEDPYLIKTSDELSYWFVSNKPYYFKLENNLDLTNTTILGFFSNLIINLDGNNKTIKYNIDKLNLFGYLTNSDIRNINLNIISNSTKCNIFRNVTSSILENISINATFNNELSEDKSFYLEFLHNGFDSKIINININLTVNSYATFDWQTFYTLYMSYISDLNITTNLPYTTNCHVDMFRNEYINLGFKNMNIKLITNEDCSISFSKFSYAFTEKHLKVYHNETLIYPTN